MVNLLVYVKRCFSTLLSVGECQIQCWLIDIGKEKQHLVKTQFHAKQKQTTHFLLVLESLPKMESHYCRKSTSKLYLVPQVQSH